MTWALACAWVWQRLDATEHQPPDSRRAETNSRWEGLWLGIAFITDQQRPQRRVFRERLVSCLQGDNGQGGQQKTGQAIGKPANGRRAFVRADLLALQDAAAGSAYRRRPLQR